MPYQNPELERLHQSKRWRLLSRYVVWRDHARCQICKDLITGAYAVDHIELATVDNFFDEDNLRTLCFNCHQAITHAGGHKERKKRPPVTDLIDF